MLWLWTLALAAAASTISTKNSTSKSTFLDLPENVLAEIGHHLLPGPDRFSFSLCSKSAYNALSRLRLQDNLIRWIVIRRYNDRYYRRCDIHWLEIFTDLLDEIRFPDVPTDIPPTIVEVIDERIELRSHIVQTAQADRIRSRFPFQWRNLFPFGVFITHDLLKSKECAQIIISKKIMAHLYPYGMIFPLSCLKDESRSEPEPDIAQLVPYCYDDRKKVGSPYRLIDVVHKLGLHRQLLELLQNPHFLEEFANFHFGVVAGLSLIIPTVSLELFREIVDLPAVRGLIELQNLRTPVGCGCDFICRHRCNLLCRAIACGRIDDIAPLLIEKTAVKVLVILEDNHSPIFNLHLTPSAVRAFLALFRFPRFQECLQRDISWLFNHLISDRSRLAALVSDPEIANWLYDTQDHFGDNFVSYLLKDSQFDALRIMLEYPDMDLKRVNQRQVSAIRNLCTRNWKAFLDCLPEPKSASLARFHEPDLITVLRKAISIHKDPAFVIAVFHINPVLVLKTVFSFCKFLAEKPVVAVKQGFSAVSDRVSRAVSCLRQSMTDAQVSASPMESVVDLRQLEEGSVV